MQNMTEGAARELLSARERLGQEELARLRATGALIVDDRRRRPLYFDGRFLTAADLTREQNYFLTRQADLGRAGGAGVVTGLRVTSQKMGVELRIATGHGVTRSGELVLLAEDLQFRVSDIPEIQRLDVAFGLSTRPSDPARNRTGLFILALRAVEFSANPIASYPTSITDTRSIQDGDIVEGVVASLIPYPDDGGEPRLRRARLARDIFIYGAAQGQSVDALPLAVVSLDRGTVEWVDEFLVRREVGSERGDVLGLGLTPRAVRESHLLEYDGHLQAVLEERDKALRGRRFMASEHFLALPPAGRMPAAAIEATDFTQSFFPAEVDVDLSIIPEDEVAVLLEESLLLPPIDLTLSGDALESTAVLVLLPVPAERIRLLRAKLTPPPVLTNGSAGATPPSPFMRPLRPAAPGLLARRRPLEMLAGLRLRRVAAEPAPPAGDPVGDAWREELRSVGGAGLLWYVRRRNMHYKADIAGVGVSVASDDESIDRHTREVLDKAGILDRFEALVAKTSTGARAEIVALLSSPKFAGSRALLTAALGELEAQATREREAREREAPKREPRPQPGGRDPGEPPFGRRGVLQVAERFANPKMGEGVARLVAARPELDTEPKVVDTLARSMRMAEIDRQARPKSEAELASFAESLLEAARSGDTGKIEALVDAKK